MLLEERIDLVKILSLVIICSALFHKISLIRMTLIEVQWKFMESADLKLKKTGKRIITHF